MRALNNAANEPLIEYTLTPLRIRSRFAMADLQYIQLAEPFTFTKGSRIMKYFARAWPAAHAFGAMLFDVDGNPGQESPLGDADGAGPSRHVG